MTEKTYIDLYKTYTENIKSNSATCLNADRDHAFKTFEKLGFPSNQIESYKYSNTKKYYSSSDYGLNINRLKIPINPYEAFKCDVPGIQSLLFFMVNDTFKKDSANTKALPEGVIICSLIEASEKYPELVNKYLGKQIKDVEDGNIAFNQAFAQDGFFMYVPENVHLQYPIQLINIMTGSIDTMATGRNLIIIEKNAKAQLLVCDHTMENLNFFANRITEVFVNENAIYEHYKLENTHKKNISINGLFIEQKAKSEVLTNIITLHNGITRNNIKIKLDGEYADTTLCGIAIEDDKQHIDNFTLIEHAQANCTSNELFKYILDKESMGVFTGKIYVAKDAQKTAAFQSNKNICLSDDSKVYTRPQLEIYADDVKCTHGATVGQLDEAALFYLRTRGIEEKEAKLLLMYAFTNDVSDNIKIPSLKDRMKMLIESRLRKEKGRCQKCMICL